MTAKKILYWIPRVLGIIFPLFLGLFALDTFGGNEPFLMQLAGFFVHLMPTYILAAILVVAWKRGMIGGLLYYEIAVFYLVMVGPNRHYTWYLFICGPAVLVGTLFIVYDIIKRRNITNNE